MNVKDLPITPGAALPPSAQSCNGVEAVRWAGVTENYHRIHWDEGFAQSEGLPRAIVNNALILAWLEGLLDATYGPAMVLEHMQARFRSPAPLEEEVRCGGTVAEATAADGGTRLRLDLWVRGADNTPRAEATATVRVPSA